MATTDPSAHESPQGSQDVVDLLKEQHDQVKQLLGELDGAQGDRRRDLFQDLVRLLAVHESAEEQIVHPAARNDAGDGVVDARLHEEDQAKSALAKLYDVLQDGGPDDPDFVGGLAQLKQDVLAHATHEEQEEFPALRQGTAADRLRSMAGAVKAAEAAAPTRPHPGVGESATANWLAGPPAALFDRTRDAVRDWRQHDR